MNKNAESLREFLSEEGFRPKYEDGRIIFKSEGYTYVVLFGDEDEDYVSLNHFVGIEFRKDKSLEVYKLANEINSQYKLGEITIDEDDDGDAITVQIDYLGPIEVFQKNFDRYLGSMHQMEADFFKAFGEISK